MFHLVKCWYKGNFCHFPIRTYLPCLHLDQGWWSHVILKKSNYAWVSKYLELASLQRWCAVNVLILSIWPTGALAGCGHSERHWGWMGSGATIWWKSCRKIKRRQIRQQLIQMDFSCFLWIQTWASFHIVRLMLMLQLEQLGQRYCWFLNTSSTTARMLSVCLSFDITEWIGSNLVSVMLMVSGGGNVDHPLDPLSENVCKYFSFGFCSCAELCHKWGLLWCYLLPLVV